jgi:hypothetical protein
VAVGIGEVPAGPTPLALLGRLGLAWAPGGRPKAVFDLTIADGRIVAIDLLLDPDVLDALDVVLLED